MAGTAGDGSDGWPGYVTICGCELGFGRWEDNSLAVALARGCCRGYFPQLELLLESRKFTTRFGTVGRGPLTASRASVCNLTSAGHGSVFFL